MRARPTNPQAEPVIEYSSRTGWPSAVDVVVADTDGDIVPSEIALNN